MKIKYNGSFINDTPLSEPRLKSPKIEDVKELLGTCKSLTTSDYTLLKIDSKNFVVQYTGGMRYQDFYSVE
jgi:hypothetical protein